MLLLFSYTQYCAYWQMVRDIRIYNIRRDRTYILACKNIIIAPIMNQG